MYISLNDVLSAGKCTETSGMNLKHVIADILIIGLSAALLWHFSNIWRYGEYLIGEPNILIRSVETAVLLSIFVFGITKFATDMKYGQRR